MARFLRIVLLTAVVFAFIPVFQGLTMPDAPFGSLQFKGKQGEDYIFELPFSQPDKSSGQLMVSALSPKGARASFDGSMITILLDEIKDLELQIVARGITMNRLYPRSELERLISRRATKSTLKALAKKSTQEAGEPGTFGPIERGETLFNIARKIGAANEELYRTVVAIWLENKGAFIRSNMNGLKVGTYISYKKLDESLSTISRAEASKIIGAQWQAWLEIGGSKTVRASKGRALSDGPLKAAADVILKEERAEAAGKDAQATASASEQAHDLALVARGMEKEFELINLALSGVREELQAQKEMLTSRLDSVEGELKNFINSAGFTGGLSGLFGLGASANSGAAAKLVPTIFVVENLILVLGLVIFSIKRMRSAGRNDD